MKIIITLIALMLAPSLMADSTHAIEASGDVDQPYTLQLNVEHGAQASAATLTISIEFQASESAEHELRLIDHGALFDDPMSATGDDHLKRVTRSDDGSLEILYTTPAASGTRPYTILINSQAASWVASGSVAVSNGDGEISGSDQLLAENGATTGGSFCFIRGQDELEAWQAGRQGTMRLKVELGDEPRKLTFFSRARTSDVTAVEIWHPAGAPSPDPTSLGEALLLSGSLNRGPVFRALIASGDGEDLDAGFHYESLGWFTGTVWIELRFTHETNPDVELELILPPRVSVLESDDSRFYGGAFFAIGGGWVDCSCCSITKQGRSALWMFALLLSGVMALALAPRTRKA